VVEGLRTKKIADRLGVEVSTAEVHRKRLMHKLGCDGTAELVRYAIREGIVPP
jgi:DNA-binding NarL/FixJ family response regulator